VSLPLGAGRLTREHLQGDPPSSDAVRALRKEVRASIASVVGRIRRAGDPQIAAGSSKTFKQLSRVVGAAPSSEGMYIRRTLTLDALHELVPRLAKMKQSQRAQLPGVSEGRAGQTLAGAIVAEAAMELLEIPELVICPWALREGVILNYMDGLDR